MLKYLTKILLLIGASLALVSCGSETQKSDLLPHLSSVASSSGPTIGLTAEPRQSVNGLQTGPVYPYNLYQNSVYGNNPSPQTPSSSGSSVLSFLRPGQGGRRSSLTSKLKSLMNAIFFRRETSSPYMPSGSSYSFSFRQPPYGFSSGYGSSYSSGLGSSSPNFLSAASGYRPVVLPNYPGNLPSGNSWSNYKQWSPNEASGQDSYSASFSSQIGNGGQYGWSNSGPGSGPLSGLNSALNPYSGSSGSNSAFQNSNTAYQAAASNSFPSATYSSSPYQSSDNSYKRSSYTNFKPVVRSSYSSGPVASASSSVSSSVSSSSTSYDPNSPGNPSSANFKQ